MGETESVGRLTRPGGSESLIAEFKKNGWTINSNSTAFTDIIRGTGPENNVRLAAVADGPIESADEVVFCVAHRLMDSLPWRYDNFPNPGQVITFYDMSDKSWMEKSETKPTYGPANLFSITDEVFEGFLKYYQDGGFCDDNLGTAFRGLFYQRPEWLANKTDQAAERYIRENYVRS